MEPDNKVLLKDLYNEADLRGECMSMAMELTK